MRNQVKEQPGRLEQTQQKESFAESGKISCVVERFGEDAFSILMSKVIDLSLSLKPFADFGWEKNTAGTPQLKERRKENKKSERGSEGKTWTRGRMEMWMFLFAIGQVANVPEAILHVLFSCGVLHWSV